MHLLNRFTYEMPSLKIEMFLPIFSVTDAN